MGKKLTIRNNSNLIQIITHKSRGMLYRPPGESLFYRYRFTWMPKRGTYECYAPEFLDENMIDKTPSRTQPFIQCENSYCRKIVSYGEADLKYVKSIDDKMYLCRDCLMGDYGDAETRENKLNNVIPIGGKSYNC